MAQERRYGDDRTIHRTGEVNVELAGDGKVVSVWFRCALVPFTQTVVDDGRAAEMRGAYQSHPPEPHTAVVFADESTPPVDHIFTVGEREREEC